MLTCFAVLSGRLIDQLSVQLSVDECGVVLGLALGAAGGRGGERELTAAAARLSGAAGLACRAALQALAGLPADERDRRLAQLGRVVGQPVPAGIERVHPGWLRAALEGESTPILLAVVAGLPHPLGAVADEIIEARREEPELRVPALVADEPLAELRRALFAGFAAMPAPDDDPDDGDVAEGAHAEGTAAPSARRLALLPVDALMDELVSRGAEILGTSLHGAPRAVIARAAANLGQRAAGVMLAAAQASPTPEERTRARALVAASSTSSSPLGATGVGPAQLVGLEVLADALGGQPDQAVRAVAQRLPPTLGRQLLRVKDRRRVMA